MLKFFRKYNLAIMGVTMAFLMVAFLLPQFIQQIAGNPGDRAVARTVSGRLTIGQSQEAAQELQVLESLGQAASQYLGGIPVSLTRDVLGVSSAGDVSESLHWLMLVEEARQGGYIAGPGSASLFLEQAADFFIRRQMELYMRFSNDMSAIESLIPSWRQQALQGLELGRLSAVGAANNADAAAAQRYVDDVLAKAAGVTQMYAAVLTGSAFSDLEAMQRVRQGLSLDAVNLRFVIFRADARLSEAPEPTQEQLQAHFDEYKNEPTNGGQFGVGYLRPPAANFEWIEVSRDLIANAVEISTLDAHSHWRKSRNTYTGEFEEERERVIEDLRQDKAEEIARFATQVVQAQILQAQERLETDERGFKILPEDWAEQRPDFNAIAQLVVERVRDRFNVEIEIPRVRSRLSWRTRGEVNVETGLGQSARGQGPQRRTAAQLIFGVREFGDDATTEGTQVGLTIGPTETFAGERYFIRVLEARPQSPPESLDEVRAAAIANWKRVWVYQRLLEREPELRQRAAVVGLEVLAEEEGLGAPPSIEWEVRSGAIAPAAGAAQQLPPPTEVNTQAFRDTALDAALAIPPTMPYDDIEPARLVLSHRVDPARSLVVARIASINPMSLEEYRRASGMLEALATDALQSALASFAPAALAQRLSFEYVGERDEDAQASGVIEPAGFDPHAGHNH